MGAEHRISGEMLQDMLNKENESYKAADDARATKHGEDVGLHTSGGVLWRWPSISCQQSLQMEERSRALMKMKAASLKPGFGVTKEDMSSPCISGTRRAGRHDMRSSRKHYFHEVQVPKAIGEKACDVNIEPGHFED